MKRLFIEVYNDYIDKFYLLDLEKEIQYVGVKNIGSYKESLNVSLVDKSLNISEQQFNEFLKLKFTNLIKMNYQQTMEYLQLQEFLI